MDNKRENWMSELSPNYQSKPLNKILIPGSHDSGAYDLDIGKGIAVDRKTQNANSFHSSINWLYGTLTYPLIHKYSIAQQIDIYKQLCFGIRYLDIRIGMIDDQTEQFYIVHNFYGPTIQLVLEDIRKFVQQHPREVIIVDLQHFWNIEQNEFNLKRILTIILDNLREFMCPTMNKIPCLKHLWQMNKTLIVVWRNKEKYQQKIVQLMNENDLNLFWSGACLHSQWPNTTRPEELKNHLESDLCWMGRHRIQLNGDTFHVCQGVLTPNTFYVIGHIFGNLRKMAYDSQQVIYEIFFKQNVSGDNAQQNRSPYLQMANIIMLDFVDLFIKPPESSTTLNLVDLIIAQNINENCS